MAPDCVGPEMVALKPKPGEVLLLENLRFHPEEEANDPEFSKQLAALADLYVNDAFGSAHRAHASTVGIVANVPQAAAGLLMDRSWSGWVRRARIPSGPVSRSSAEPKSPTKSKSFKICGKSSTSC